MCSTTLLSSKPTWEARLLEVRGLKVSYGGINAVKGIDLDVAEGELVTLIGANGAGKTTLFNILTGLYQPDAGELVFEGACLTGLKPYQVAEHGIARTFQNIRLFANMSALENVMVGRHVRTRAGVPGAVLRGAATRAEEREITRRAYELLDYVGIAGRAAQPAYGLAYGDQRRLEIARALATEPKLLALDEPAAGMNATERAELKRLLERICASGITLLLIEHDVRLEIGRAHV